MLNNNGLLGERRITFNHDINKSMPQDKLFSALLGSAVLYKDEEVYITKVYNIMDYFSLLSFDLSNGVNVNQSEVRFFMSDENDETESSNSRIESIKNEYNIYKDFDVRLPPANKNFLLKTSPSIKASYDVKKAEELRDTLSGETDTFIKLYHNGRENFLSIINTLKHVIVKVQAGENNEASIITTIQDYMYNSRPPKLEDNMVIKFNYDDILIKINGTFVPVTAKNLKFIYDYKHLTFKELLEKHNNKEIKTHLGELPK